MIKKILFFSTLLVVFYARISAQEIEIDYENPKEYEIVGLETRGIKYLDSKSLLHVSGLKVGQKIMVPGNAITEAVKKMWKQKMFSDVEINILEIKGDKIRLEIYLQERPRLSQTHFFGVKKTDKEELIKKLSLVKGRQITENTLMLSKNIIKDYYAEKGFAQTEVRIFQKQDTSYHNSVFLNIYVNKHRKTRIDEIKIEQNTVFTDRKIQWRKLKDTKRRRWYGLFKPSKFIRSKYEADKKNLILEYNKLGYRDAQIVQDSVYQSPKNPKNVNILLKVDEGKQYYFRNIRWIGNKEYDSRDLNKKLDIKKGDVYDTEKLNDRLIKDEDAVANLYMNNGHLFFNVRPVEMRIDNDSVDIELRMYEGPKARIQNIIIKGNQKTNDNVIRRELFTVPGELFSRSDLVRSVRELATLGYFDPEQLVPTPIPNQADGTVDIEYSVAEIGNDKVELSGGWGGMGLVLRVGLAFNNFSIQNIFNKDSWDPLPMGDGQKFSINAMSNGSSYQQYSISFQEPWLGGKKPNSLSISLYYNRMTNRHIYNLNPEILRSMDVIGTSVGLGRRLKWPDNYFTLYTGIGYRHYILNRWNRDYIREVSTGRVNGLTFNVVLGRNSVDNPYYARRGSNFSIGLELTPPYSLLQKGKDYASMPAQDKYRWMEYHKWSGRAQWFTQLIGDLVFHSKVEFGLLGYYNKDIGYPPLGGYSVGGSGMSYYSYGVDVIQLRGYSENGLTPNGGGYIYDKYTLELRYPVVLKESTMIFGLIFAEAGNAWSGPKEFNPFSIKRSAGAGVRLFLPMLGLLGFDWGYGFDAQPGETASHKGEFHFTMGKQF